MHLEGRAKLGFYPTPDRLLPVIASYVASMPMPGHGMLFDPCAGDGTPVATLAAAWNLNAWGAELHDHRAQQAATRCHTFIQSDAFQVHLPRPSCHGLFLNPPYDQQRHQRTETQWLEYWNSALIPDGLLCFIIQERTIPALLEYLVSYYRDLHITTFPEPEYEAFGQVVIFGRKRRSPYFSQPYCAELYTQLRHLQPLRTQPHPLLSFPPHKLSRQPSLSTSWYDLDTLGPEALRLSWNQPRVTDLLEEPDVHACRPLMPLRPGHTAQLITAGFMNNELLKTDTHTYLVKGSSKKVLVDKPPIIEAKRTIQRQKEQFRPQIFAWDLQPGPNFGRFIEVQTPPPNECIPPISEAEPEEAQEIEHRDTENLEIDDPLILKSTKRKSECETNPSLATIS